MSSSPVSLAISEKMLLENISPVAKPAPVGIPQSSQAFNPLPALSR
jgi:hypothetical protein